MSGQPTVPRDRASAKALVERITKEHGHLSDERLENVEDPELRREIQEALLKKDRMIGSSVITLSKNLYTSKARFVFELLQNADDNSYCTANSSGTEPFVSFQVHPRRIVVECNEDGFTHENLSAICSVGQSSKKGAQGYIGEKGIGFKSVFMAAWKVHIQSGAFSFFFIHKPGGSGMGMISPIWEDGGEQLPQSPLTRITLHLHETGDEAMMAATRQTIEKQFEELQETFLLFMKNLRKINVAFYNEMGEMKSSASYSVEKPEPNHAVLRRSKSREGTVETRANHFHVTTHEATNLAKNDNRSYSVSEERSRAYSKSQIVLAFPLSETFEPFIKPQDVFVFLPVRQAGFSFLIQADFVTDAARQDIVRDSLRNSSLLEGVADAFIKAVRQFCQHSTLKYQWMRYLPDRASKTWGPLWNSLVDNIAARLSKTPVLLGRLRLDQPRLISDMFRILDQAMDGEGKPLFEDIDADRILSFDYARKDSSLLFSYGLPNIGLGDVLRLLRADLDQGTRSRMKSPRTTEAWHERAAILLHQMFEAKWEYGITELRKLHLLPLDDGTWVSASPGPVYFAHTGTMEIPPGSGLRLISKKATNHHRKVLFTDLGVQEATTSFVREKILLGYQAASRNPVSSIPVSKAHLKFLYLSHHLKNDEQSLGYSRLAIFDHTGARRMPFTQIVYIKNDEPYGPWQLFQETEPGSRPGDGAPGHNTYFVDDEYFKDSPATPAGQELTWLQWFYQELEVKKVVYMGENKLSPYGDYLQRHRPDRFLNCFRMWAQGSTSNSVQYLKAVEVLCGAGGATELVPFESAYFPTETLKQRVRRFLPPGSFFPWLWIDKTESFDAIPPQWKSFLNKVGAGTPRSDLEFALVMLEYFTNARSCNLSASDKVRIFELYEHISIEHRGAKEGTMSQANAAARIRTLFDENEFVYVPLGLRWFSSIWTHPSKCVWKAPQKLGSKYALERLYKEDESFANFKHLSGFFTDVVGIGNCDPTTLINELRDLREKSCDNIDTISGLYAGLQSMKSRIIGLTKDEVRDIFDTDALIYVPLDDDYSAWHKTSQCVWSSAARLRGRISLNDEYGQFEDLFVNILGVKQVDLQMAVDELKEIGSKPNATREEVKESIQTVNSLLPESSEPPSPHDVVTGRIFPVRNPTGIVTLNSRATEFFIADRESLRSAFQSKVKFLDFSLEEVVRLLPFLEWTGLELRYLSKCVSEMTSFHGDAARPTSNPDRQILNRAHAILRIANHFNSPRVQGQTSQRLFYEILKSAEIYETNGISSDLVLTQDNVPHTVAGQIQTLHIDESGGCLKVYVPQSKDDQEYIFTNVLSQRLFEWMMEHPVTHISGHSMTTAKDGVTAIRDVMLAPRSRLDRALDANGISMIDILNTNEDVVSEPESPTTPVGVVGEGSEPSGSDTGLQTPTTSNAGISPSREAAGTPSRSALSSPLGRHEHVPRSRSSISPSATIAPPATPSRATSAPDALANVGYVALLNKVIELGRRNDIPTHGAFDMSLLQARVPGGAGASNWGLGSLPQMERDFKVGAAGELYVFELLANLIEPRSLPNFSRANWQSNIRSYVTVHPDYHMMPPWLGRETSDLVYDDTEGALTDCLIERGYMTRVEWGGRGPRYFVEVKATTSSWDTPFYMSKAQYRRMQENTGTTGNSSTIYVIFRVYNLGQDNMGLKIYLDPEALRVSEALKFTAESWSVVPTYGL
ncbi:hypothetical protein PG996_003133 [Apiospora saccharicola]|uniref:Protein NO VEIN C-terminal domain-containing protein n=1 Tax=Apiospora saccharicola TaxID=335842 RepID=A0ABR1W0F5_9PEZI